MTLTRSPPQSSLPSPFKDLSLETLEKGAQLLLQEQAPIKGTYFKTGPGEYAEHDYFLGLNAYSRHCLLHSIQKAEEPLTLIRISQWLASPYNDLRLVALQALIGLYQSCTIQQSEIYRFYLDHLPAVNNWNLVDASAHKIVGPYLYHYLDPLARTQVLQTLIQHEVQWPRRVAVVACLFLTKKQQLTPILELAEQLLDDPEDLMHKAVGWQLREVGKQNRNQLTDFLEREAHRMPRVMLRYALEHYDPLSQKYYRGLQRERALASL